MLYRTEAKAPPYEAADKAVYA